MVLKRRTTPNIDQDLFSETVRLMNRQAYHNKCIKELTLNLQAITTHTPIHRTKSWSTTRTIRLDLICQKSIHLTHRWFLRLIKDILCRRLTFKFQFRCWTFCSSRRWWTIITHTRWCPRWIWLTKVIMALTKSTNFNTGFPLMNRYNFIRSLASWALKTISNRGWIARTHLATLLRFLLTTSNQPTWALFWQPLI